MASWPHEEQANILGQPQLAIGSGPEEDQLPLEGQLHQVKKEQLRSDKSYHIFISQKHALEANSLISVCISGGESICL